MLFLDLHGHSRKTDVFFYGGIRNWSKIRHRAAASGNIMESLTDSVTKVLNRAKTAQECIGMIGTTSSFFLTIYFTVSVSRNMHV